MRAVVVDPEYLAAGVLGRMQPRRFLGLLAYGRWCLYSRLFGPAEESLDVGPIVLRGGPTLSDLQALGDDRAARLRERLPYGAPDDLVLVATSRIHDAVVDRVQLARTHDTAAREHTEIEAVARRVLARITAMMAGEIGGAHAETESLRDHLITVAALASAPLVTDDTGLAQADGEMWEHTAHSGRPAFAVTSSTFVSHHVDAGDFELADVPYELLDLALAVD